MRNEKDDNTNRGLLIYCYTILILAFLKIIGVIEFSWLWIVIPVLLPLLFFSVLVMIVSIISVVMYLKKKFR